MGQKQCSVIKEATKATKAGDKADEKGLSVEEWFHISLENSIYKISAGAEQAHKIQLHILSSNTTTGKHPMKALGNGYKQQKGNTSA